MPSGLLPTYAYVPPQRPNIEPNLRSASTRRGRLFAGGTYFRSRDVGLQANNITVEVLEFTPWDGSTGEAYCIVTNRNLKFDENVVGDVSTSVLDLKGTYQDLWIVDELHTDTPRAQYYSISCQIRIAIQNGQPYTLTAPSETSVFQFNKLFTSQGKLSVKSSKTDVVLTSGSRIFIAPRTRIYALSGKSDTDPDTMTTTYGWDIEALRTAINADNQWIEMLERSGPIDDGMGGTTPNPNPVDVQDEGTDSTFLTPFAAKNLEGADGLPATPTNENTGPSRSLVHVNYGEKQNGELAEISKVYEWVGDNAIAGSWKAY